MHTYRMHISYKVVMANTSKANATAAAALAAQATAFAATQGTVLHYRRAHPGGGVLGRCSYSSNSGCGGIVVFDVAMFANGIAPATIVLQGLTLAGPTARKVAGVTSAVVAAGVAGVALAAGTPIAAPATVAAAAPAVAVALAAQAPVASASVANGKAAAAAVFNGMRKA